MRAYPFILLTSIAACTVETIPTDPELAPVADPLVARAEQLENTEINISVSQPDPYAAIISQNFEDLRFVFESNSLQLSLSNFGSQQILYPQLRP